MIFGGGRKMKSKLEQYVPLGIEHRQQMRWIGIGVALSFLYSLGFLFRLSQEYHALFRVIGRKKVLIQGASMPDFVDILGNSLIGFLIVALCMLALLAYYYFYHYQGSKSIYLMKRLPRRWELMKRCVTLPVLSAVAVLLLSAMLLLLYFGIYFLVTPEPCLAPNQWYEFWSVY